MVYTLRVVALSPQIFVYWNTAQCFALWASSGATDEIQNSKQTENSYVAMQSTNILLSIVTTLHASRW